MDAADVIKLLKEHLKAKEKERGLRRIDKNYSINYVMDFLCLTKPQAIQFLKENIPMVIKL